ncbi:phage tail protein I [Ruegeria sp. Ofav3-42]|uniref:phage tail protein I n=1 Tax=Ruegeria sp. Ofav3-42 TaxID=2917759 RepID=UPI001EF41B7A|nr:phage tail protein I [Ruegeria sp. Ofav3-42]MCG7518847.1 phage tail protein I [Ruegeria sp. Ofav3-42]
MAGYWENDQLDRITPPQVKDARGTAYLRALNEIIRDQPITAFQVKEAETCPAEALPALIAEYSMQEFIDPELPEAIQRRILKNAWELQSLEGYDAGVKLGLSLMGMTADIEQWYRQTPLGAANTHRLTIMVDDVLYPDDDDGYFSPRQTRATLKMIEATKRQSQDTDLRIGVVGRSRSYAGAFPLTHTTAIADAVIDPPPVLGAAASMAVVPTTRITSIVTTA